MVSSYIPKTSETDISKGVSSESTPTSNEEAEHLNMLRNISSSSGRRKRSTSSSSLSSSTQSSNEDSLREQYIEGSPKEQPVSEAPTKIDLSPSQSTTQRVAREQLEQSSVTVKPIIGKDREIDLPKTRTTVTREYVPYNYSSAQPKAISAASEKEAKATRKVERQENIDITAREILDFDRKPDFETLKNTPLLVGRTAFRFGKGAVESFNVYAIGKGAITTGAGLVSGEVSLGDVKQGMSDSFIKSPAETIGNIVGPALVLKGISSVAKAKVRTGEYVDPEVLFKAEQLKSLAEGTKPTLPKTGSSAETIAKFESTRKGARIVPDYERVIIEETTVKPKDFIVATDDYAAVTQKVSGYQTEGSIYAQTSSPASIKGGKAGVGNKASFGLEDPGIYTTPAGEGSVAFLRLESYGETTIGIPSKDLLSVPTVTRFKAKGIETLPSSVSEVPGFKEVAVFQEAKAGSGKLLVTKRSQIGQGELPKQSYISEDSFILGNKKVKLGDTIIEGGTTELEAVVPLGQKFVKTRTDRFTKLDGKTIRVRDVELVVEAPGGKLTTSSGKSITPSDKLISGEQILSEQSSFVSSAGSKVTPGFPSITTSSLKEFSIIESTTPGLLTSSVGAGSSSNFRPSSSVIDVSGSSSPVSDSLRDYNITSSSRRRKESSPVIGSTPSVPPSDTITLSGGSSSEIISPKKTFYPSSVPTTKTPKIQPGLPTPTYYKIKAKEDKKFYDVQVRRKGEFQSIFRTSNKDIAFRTGESEIKGRSSASFKILRDGIVVTPNKTFKQLYESKTEKGVLIEKKKYRINTPGEKSEITLKGIFSTKKTKGNKKDFSFKKIKF